MKKLIILLALFIGFVASSSAQDITIYKSQVVEPILVFSDTILNTESNDTTIELKCPKNQIWAYSIHTIGANISGTSDVDVDYEWSNNGTDFLTHTSDSIAASNYQYILEDLTGFGARYMRITRTGVGTHLTKMTGYLYVFPVPK